MSAVAVAPHHDGSERHVSTLEPALGDTVTVWLRVPHADPAPTGSGCARCRDGEPHFDAARGRPRRTAARDVVARPTSPCATRSRTTASCSTAGRPGTASSTAPASTSARSSDAVDFRLSAYAPPPAWLADTVVLPGLPGPLRRAAAHRASWRRRGRSVGGVGRPGRHRRRRAGAPAVRRRPRRRSRPASTTSPSLGVSGLYLTPFFPAPSSHRYDADTFDHVDPLLGGDDALAGLVKACHNRGIRVIGDLTINHVGARHDWFRAAQADAAIAGGRVLLLPPPPRRLRGLVRRAVLPKLDLRDDGAAPPAPRRARLGDRAVAAAAVRPRRLARRRRQHGRAPRRHRRQPRRGRARCARRWPRSSPTPTSSPSTATTPAATSTATAGTA